jgi:ankyrin repeat protein
MDVQRLYNLCRNATRDSESSLRKIQSWMDCHQHDRELLHAAANYKNKNRMMPLHVVVWKRPPLSLIVALIGIAPTSVQEVDAGGRLPLHHACMWGSSLDILDLLVTKFPASVHIQDKTGRTPSQILQLFHAAEKNYDGRPLLLHQLCCITSQQHHPLNIPLLQLVVDAFPDALTIRDNGGRTPSSLLKKCGALQKTDDYGMLPLHQQAQSNPFLSVNLLMLLFHSYPEGIAQTDNNGLLPFHHACLNKLTTAEVLKLFIELYPECLIVK